MGSQKALSFSLLCGLSVFLAVLLLICGCVEVGELQVESRSVEPEGAESADIEFDMISGNMEISGGTDNLLDAEFRYNVEDWRPEMEYEVRENTGRLTVRQPEVQGAAGGNQIRNEWDLRLNQEMPINLSAELDNGNSDLSLGSSLLKTLAFNTDNGNAQVELTGNQSLLEQVNVTHSNGDVLLTLSGNYPSLSVMTIESANGNIQSELSGSYSSLDHVRIKLSNGNILADLTGNWSQNSSIEVLVNTGEITLQLPRNTGVHVETATPVAVEAAGFRQEGDAYFNDAYGDSEVTLNISASSSIGSIRLQLED
jgi:hypothetical protein